MLILNASELTNLLPKALRKFLINALNYSNDSRISQVNMKSLYQQKLECFFILFVHFYSQYIIIK